MKGQSPFPIRSRISFTLMSTSALEHNQISIQNIAGVLSPEKKG
jgi:hypothetical protein